MPAALPPGKEPPPPDRRLGGTQSRSGLGGEEKKIPALEDTGCEINEPDVIPLSDPVIPLLTNPRTPRCSLSHSVMSL